MNSKMHRVYHCSFLEKIRALISATCLWGLSSMSILSPCQVICKTVYIYPSDLKKPVQSLGRNSGQGTTCREWHPLFKCCNAALGFCLSSLRAGFKSPTTALFVLDIEQLCRNTFALYLTIWIPAELCILRWFGYIPKWPQDAGSEFRQEFRARHNM